MKKPAFTLIELLVVIVIVGILVSLVSPSFMDFRRRQMMDETVQIIKTAFAEGFSTSRSKADIYAFSFDRSKPTQITQKTYDYRKCFSLNGSNKFELKGTTECTDTEEEKTISFVGSAKIITPNFEFYYLPPHGDIATESGFSSDKLAVELKDSASNKRKITVYAKSGLITTK